MSVKLTYSICTLGDYNYWAIPKCGNTTVKYLMLHKYGLAIHDDLGDSIYRWVHSESKMKYITPDEANSNGKQNFTFVRDPVERFISLHKDFCIRRKEIPEIYGNSPEELLQYLQNNTDERSLNIHCRSMSYFLEKFAGKIYTIEGLEYKLNSTFQSAIISDTVREQVAQLWHNDYKWLENTQPSNEFIKWINV